jgi:hypothetical protein
MQDILLIAYVALLLAAAVVVTVLKGKWGMLVAGGLVFSFAWVVAALRWRSQVPCGGAGSTTATSSSVPRRSLRAGGSSACPGRAGG